MFEIVASNEYENWLLSLDKATLSRVLTYVARLRVGNMSNTKRLGSGLSELKCNFGPGYRIYFSQQGKTLILLLSGGDKSTQAKDIKLSKELLKKYRR